MYRRAIASICFAVGVLTTSTAIAQPSPLPTVTAESEPWYLSGEPLTYEGNFYYPRGAAVHFDRDEMVRSGFYRGIPLYARTTIEPFSVVFVPLAGGILQPYERLRTGALAGTSGSLGPGLPLPGARDTNADASTSGSAIPQAAGPPTGLPGPTDVTGTARSGGAGAGDGPAVVGRAGEAAPPQPVGTAGRVVVLPRPRPLVSAARPTGANGMFVEFRNVRWFAEGPTVAFDAGRFTRIGEYHGLAVFARSSDDRTIYIPTTANVSGLLARYSRR